MGSERRESAQGWTAWVVGVVGTARAQPHTSVRATTVRRCAWCHHSHPRTHSGQGGAADTVVVVGGNGAQWWWQPHHTHSHHHHVPTTPCVCVCVDGGVDSTSTASEWTKWPHTPQHPRCHHTHPHPPAPAAAARGLVEWSGAEGVGGGVSGEPGAATANTVPTHTHTHQGPKWTSHQPCVCVWRGGVPCLCV